MEKKAEDSRETGPAAIPDPLDWREQLAARVAGFFLIIYSLAAPVLVLTLNGFWVRVSTICVMLASAALAGLPSLLGSPKGPLRVWLLLGPALFCSLAGFALVGFLSGPAVILTLTLVTGGLLLGRRGLLILCLIALAGLIGIAWSVLNGVLPVPNVGNISLTSARAWIRTIVVMSCAAFVLGMLILDIVSRLEKALLKARSETALREQAERAKAAAGIAAQEAKQLETLGRLTAGIAHDFNNHLAAILGSAELLQMEASISRRGHEHVSAIIKSSEISASLTRQLLVYSRKAQMVLKPIDFHPLIEGALTLLRGSMPADIDIRLELSAAHSVLHADEALMQNAIVNLIVNARDAMPNGGRLTLSTSDHEVRARNGVSDQGIAPGNYVLFKVADTGTGIDKTILPNIFEPFFTTKPIGKGTGLGLAAVLGTVRSHGGSVDVQSEPGEGAVFRLLLPQADARLIHDGGLQPQIVRGSGHILLVDDDTVVRGAAEAMMRLFGYEVTAVGSGELAIEKARTRKGSFDLVVLDLRMPNLGGVETFARVHAFAPDLPVLIWSGHCSEQEEQRLLSQGAAGFLQKPYAVGELSRTLARLIATHAPGP